MSHPLNELGPFVTSADANASEDSGAPSLITAGGGLDNVKVTGQGIDRRSGSAIAHSAVVATGYLAALDTDETISLAHELQESADNSSFDAAEVIEAATVKATAAAAGNERGVDGHDLNLRTRKRYFRINVTANLSRANTDTCLFFTIVTLGGWTQVPQSG